MNESALTALVSSRICHDLISPIGAISNGVELMAELGVKPSPELALICDSVDAAATKLRYFRIAFGAAPPEARIGGEDLRTSVTTMFGERFVVTMDQPGDSVSRLAAKALLLALLCLEKSLPLGGRIGATLSDNALRLLAEAPRLRMDPELWAILDGAPAGADTVPAEVQFLILADLIRQHGLALDTRTGDGTVEMHLSGL